MGRKSAERRIRTTGTAKTTNGASAAAVTQIVVRAQNATSSGRPASPRAVRGNSGEATAWEIMMKRIMRPLATANNPTSGRAARTPRRRTPMRASTFPPIRAAWYFTPYRSTRPKADREGVCHTRPKVAAQVQEAQDHYKQIGHADCKQRSIHAESEPQYEDRGRHPVCRGLHERKQR